MISDGDWRVLSPPGEEWIERGRQQYGDGPSPFDSQNTTWGGRSTRPRPVTENGSHAPGAEQPGVPDGPLERAWTPPWPRGRRRLNAGRPVRGTMLPGTERSFRRR